MASYCQSDNEQVLDVGCGTGNYALALAEVGFDVVGVDFAPGMLKKAGAKAAQLPQASVIFEQADFNRDLHFPTDSFDCAICIHALQCVADPPRFLREIRRVLKPDGLFLVVAVDSSQTVAPKKKLKTTLPRLIFWKLKALASKSKQVRKYTRDELMVLLMSAGFEVVEERIYPGTIALMSRAECKMQSNRKKLAAPCGLYCGVCSDLVVDGVCHGCGCDCGQCAAGPHRRACDIYRCVTERGLESCAECEDFPCTRVIQFAYDPIWRTHLPVLENLRRIRRIGVEAWLDEQEAYWADQRRRDRWLQLHRECGVKYEQIYLSS